MTRRIEDPWPTNDMSLAKAAVGYQMNSRHIFPVWGVDDNGNCLCGDHACKSVGKHPMTPNGHKDATNNLGQIMNWWKEHPNANIGIALEEDEAVLDLDEENALEKLAELGLEVPDGLMAATGRGIHVYLTVDEPVRPATDIFKDHPSRLKADFRTEGSYVVAPPSRHETGVQYRWIQRGVAADAPRRLYEILDARRSKKTLSRGSLDGFAEGTRNDEVFRSASRYRHLGLTVDEARPIILQIASNCRPRFDSEEAERCLQSAFSYGEDSAQVNTDSQPGDTFVRLSELTEDETVLEPPQFVVPRIACAGRVTLLAAREKLGKSTFAGAAAAQVAAGGEFLEGHCLRGRVLWAGLEEHKSDIARRFARFRAEEDCIYVATSLPYDFADLDVACQLYRPRLIVVDTLANLVKSKVKDSSSSAAWTPIMDRLASIARSTNAAVLVLHHARKSDGKYRDSSAIGAGVDIILEMLPDRGLQTQRRLEVKSRFEIPDSRIRFKGRYFELVEGCRSLARRITEFLADHPGASRNQVTKSVSSRKNVCLLEIKRLLDEGQLIDRGSDGTSALYVKRPTPKKNLE